MPAACASTAPPTRRGNPRDAERAGFAFIHQELNLFTNLSIAENIFITRMPRRRGGTIDRRELAARTAGLLAAVGLNLPPDTPVERLSPGERQLVEVAKALQLDARIIIFDEPTTSLTPRETARLFELIGRLTAAGTTIIYISHVLGDVRALADDVAVLRDGAARRLRAGRRVPGRADDHPNARPQHRAALPHPHAGGRAGGAARGPRAHRRGPARTASTSPSTPARSSASSG